MLHAGMRLRRAITPLSMATALAMSLPAAASSATVVDRDEYSTTVNVGGGKLRTTLSSEPLNFQTGSGEWTPIDTVLGASASGNLHPAAVDGDVSIPTSLSEAIKLEHEGRSASFRLLGAEGNVEVDGAQASYAHAIPGVDVSYIARPYGVKETLKLQTALAPRSFVYDFRGAAGWSASVESGEVVLRDSDGAESYRVSAPLAWDSASDPAFTNTLRLSVTKVADGRWRVTLRPDADWLSDPTRQFPVFIDPDFSWASGTTHFHGAQDCYLSGYTQANYTFCAQTYLQTGWYNRPYRSIFKFDIASAIPSNATVSAAQFKSFAPPQSAHIAMGHKLQTITSDWDSTATWNNRKAGTPWATAGGGGDVSAAANLTSASTSVQAYNAWYSWNAPLAAVQGWVSGTLPNYGFMLSTDNAGNIGNAYAWASTEASTSSQFPADASKWPTLDVTWSQPPADTTAPDAPNRPYVAASDFAAKTAEIYFNWPQDNAPSVVPASGTDVVQYRVARRGGPIGAWSETRTDNFVVEDVKQGDQLDVELRARDKAGNVSSSTIKTFSTFSDDALETSNLDAMTASFIERYSTVTSQQASSWLEAQGRITEGLQTLDDTNAGRAIAGVEFDNAALHAHVRVLTSAYNSQIQSILDYLQVQEYVTIESVATSRDQLAGALAQLQSSKAALFTTGKVFAGIPQDLSGLNVWFSSAATTADRNEIEAGLSALAVPYSTVTTTQATVALPAAEPLSGYCGAVVETPPATAPPARPTTDPLRLSFPFWEQEHETPFRHLRCNGDYRGGVAIKNIGPNPEAATGDNQGTCTSAFTALGGSTGASPYMLTAGHCVTDAARLNAPVGADGLRPWQRDYYSQVGPNPLGAGLDQLIGRVASEVRYNGWYDLAANPTGDWSDAAAIRMTGEGNFAGIDRSRIGPWFFRYNEPRTVLTRVRGVASVQDDQRGVASGLWVCINGKRTGLQWSDNGQNNNCGPVLDVLTDRNTLGSPTVPQERTHRIAIGSCSARPGDSGAAITDVNNRAVGILSGSATENVLGSEKAFDRLEALTGQALPRCPNGVRGLQYAQPVEEASRDLGMRILTTRWRPQVTTTSQPTNFSRVTASWNRRVDVDLYVFDGQGHQAGRLTPNAIPDGELLVNANRGFGPEEFVERANAGRTYTIGVCYYSGEGPTRVDIEIRDPDGSSRVVPVTLAAPGSSQLVGSSPTGANVPGIPSNFCSQSGAGADGRGAGNPGGGWPATCFATPANNWCTIYS